MTRLLVFICVFCVTRCYYVGDASLSGDTDILLTFLHTSDIHSRLFPYRMQPLAADRNLGLLAANAPFGGGSRLAYLIKRERARADRVLHLDSGDCFQGVPIFNTRLGEAEVRFLSEVGLDGAVIGNHEFDAGLPNLVTQMERWKKFDLLAANYVFPDPNDVTGHTLGRISRPYAIYNVRGLRIAVIGMGNLGSLTSIGEGGNSLRMTPMEQNETLRAYVNILHDSVDLIVVLSHLGLTEDEDLIRGYETVVWKDRLPKGWTITEDLGDGRVMAFVPGVQNIDIILGGHLHTVLNPPKMLQDRDGRTVILSHSGAFAKDLGRLDVVLKKDSDLHGFKVESHK